MATICRSLSSGSCLLFARLIGTSQRPAAKPKSEKLSICLLRTYPAFVLHSILAHQYSQPAVTRIGRQGALPSQDAKSGACAAAFHRGWRSCRICPRKAQCRHKAYKHGVISCMRCPKNLTLRKHVWEAEARSKIFDRLNEKEEVGVAGFPRCNAGARHVCIRLRGAPTTLHKLHLATSNKHFQLPLLATGTRHTSTDNK